MSYLLECLGRGLLSQLLDAFAAQLSADPDDDATTLQRRRRESPSSIDLALRLGLVHLRALQLDGARDAFETALELATGTNAALQPALGLACVYDEHGRFDRSLHYLAIAQACDPRDPAISFAIGFCHERLDDLDAAAANYAAAIELCPQLRNAHERLAAIAIRRADWRAALHRYELLAELDPADLDVQLTLGNLRLAAGEPAEGVQHYQRALLIEPECTPPPLESAEQQAAEGDLGVAIAALERLVAECPGIADYHVSLADLYAQNGDDEAALQQYSAALKLQPNYLEATVKLGTQHLRRGRLVDAAQFFNRAVELNDRLMCAFVGLGVAQHAAGHEQEAHATFDLAASLEPNTTLLFSEATRLRLRCADDGDNAGAAETAPATDEQDAPDPETLLRDAIRRHEQALRATPRYADLHYRHGLLLRQAGRPLEAIAAFRRAVEINPNYTKALLKLGVCLKELGRASEALAAFRQALSVQPRDVKVHYELGLLFAQRNRFDLAVEHFEVALGGDAENLAFRQNLALALQNIGMVDRAAATWRSICELARQTPGLTPARAVKPTHGPQS
jgi:superkiller protein 3